MLRSDPKILYLMDESWDSGLTASALTLASLLNQNGTSSCAILGRKNSYAENQAKKFGLDFYSTGAFWPFRVGEIANWVQSQKFDILHAHTGSTHTLAWLIKRRLPHVAVLRTRADAGLIRKNAFYSQLLSKTKFVVFASQRQREDFLVTYDYPIAQTRVIYPTIENLDSRFHGNDGKENPNDGSLARHSRGSGNPVPLKITILGRLDPVKGHEDFIAAAALVAPKFPNVKFEVIGEEKNTKISKLNALARRLGLSQRLSFRGFLEPSALEIAIQETGIAVVASRASEVVSRVCLEWMRVAKPIVATKAGVIPELIEDGQSGLLVEPSSPEEMGYALQKLIEDFSLRERLGQAAQKRFDAFFAPAIVRDQTLNLYREILACD